MTTHRKGGTMDLVIGLALIALIIYSRFNKKKEWKNKDEYKDAVIQLMELLQCNYKEAKLVRDQLSRAAVPLRLYYSTDIIDGCYYFSDQGNYIGYFKINDKYTIIKLVYNDINLLDVHA